MKNKLIIVGASGHGKVVADIAQLNGYTDIAFLDDNKSVTECAGYPVIGNTNAIVDGDMFVAIGNSIIRQELMNRFIEHHQPVLIHPNSVVAKDVKIGSGSIVMAGAVINPGTTIGQGCIINTSSSVDHDCVLGNFVHIAVGAHICGTVTIGDSVWIGAGATVRNNISICKGCMIGMGAVVIKDIGEPGTYVGFPAKKIKAGTV